MCLCVFICMHGGGERGAGGRKFDLHMLKCTLTHSCLTLTFQKKKRLFSVLKHQMSSLLPLSSLSMNMTLGSV